MPFQRAYFYEMDIKASRVMQLLTTKVHSPIHKAIINHFIRHVAAQNFLYDNLSRDDLPQRVCVCHPDEQDSTAEWHVKMMLFGRSEKVPLGSHYWINIL